VSARVFDLVALLCLAKRIAASWTRPEGKKPAFTPRKARDVETRALFSMLAAGNRPIAS
jgi:hypothetical protein